MINYNQEYNKIIRREAQYHPPPARDIFKEAFVMEAANYALLAAAESIILWIAVARVGGAV